MRRQLAELQGIDAFKTQLTRVLDGASALDQAGIGSSPNLLSALVKELETMRPAESKESLPLQVDSALHVQSPTLHTGIGLAAAQVAEFLLRQTPLPNGFRSLQEYRQLFLEKYGEYTEVPVLDLLSPENGLGAPPGYEMPPRAFDRSATIQPTPSQGRDELLLTLVAAAINQHQREVELTEEIQHRLERWSPNLKEAPLSLEIYLHLHAQSREEMDRGNWTAVVGRNCGSYNGGRTFGRFFDLLGESGMEALHDLVKREETLQPDVIFAELSYQPSQARQANVAIRPPLRSYEIAVGVTPAVAPERVLSLSDLVIGIQHGRFYLRSLRLKKQVQVRQTHMLNLQRAPNVCRFLSKIANDCQPALSSFDWGAAADAPFLPRLVIKTGPSSRLVITPACWQLRAAAITPTGKGSAEARWFQGLQQWRKQWRVARYVYLVEMDNRLLLDLENPLVAAELQDELADGQKRVTLDEVLPDFEHLWLQDKQGDAYFSEIVVPLLRADAFDPTRQPETEKGTKAPTPRQQIITPNERNCFPGEAWVYLKLYAAPTLHQNILAGPLREVVMQLQAQNLIDRWFFIRYVDPEPHLRLRFHAKRTADVQAILAITLAWSAQLARSGQIQHTTLDTYEREVERYGGPEAIDLLEQAFTVNSVMVSDLIAFHHARRITIDALAVAVFTLDRIFTAWGSNFQQRQQWTHQASEKYEFSKEFRPERKHYCELLSAYDQATSNIPEQHGLLIELTQQYENSLREIGAQVHQLAAQGDLWVAETSLMSSLAHMHINRLLGIERTRERQVYAFWRHTLDSLERRPEQKHLTMNTHGETKKRVKNTF